MSEKQNEHIEVLQFIAEIAEISGSDYQARKLRDAADEIDRLQSVNDNLNALLLKYAERKSQLFKRVTELEKEKK